MNTPRYDDISRMIDHSLLAPSLTIDELEAGLSLALAYDVASVCILPYYMARCAERLAGSSVRPSTTIGFPHGGHHTSTKAKEAETVIADGCQELDMVVNISQVLSGNWSEVQTDIQAVIDVAHASQRQVKVIFENCCLQNHHKIRLCEICGELNADWVKTSTGFGTGGATLEDVQLMRTHAPRHVQVKAAGGIRDLGMLLQMRELGVTRVGASQTRQILDECRERLNLPPISI
ncbi:deoxyribose-phosphate aldolase [Planctomicrobium sp. SH661]|uniref:deoxyribose-phosphate aldolase n=1 Tax=Planctomicrobium sp. SH661 TaxID=3448124 RepID=UPI003F5BB905